MKTTPEMRARLRELSAVDGRDDYDRCVLDLLDDFDAMTRPTPPSLQSVVGEDKLAELLAGLEGVTAGPWEVKTPEEWHGGFDFFGGSENAFVFCADVEAADAAHIARCDPDTIRSLITRLQSSEAQTQALREALESEREACAAIADDMWGDGPHTEYDNGATADGWNAATREISAAIRARATLSSQKGEGV